MLSLTASFTSVADTIYPVPHFNALTHGEAIEMLIKDFELSAPEESTHGRHNPFGGDH